MTEDYKIEIFVEASPERVFDYFLEPELLVQWIGDYARLVPEQGGLFSVDINGVLIRGRYELIERPSRLEFSWGQAGNDLMPPESTRVTITCVAEGRGTRLALTHTGLLPVEAAKHAIGWPHFIERLSVAATGQSPGRDPWADAPPR